MLLTACFIQSYNIQLQSLILLLLSGIYLLITHAKKPFVTNNQNELENASNISSFLIVLVYNLLTTEIQENVKSLLIILLIFFSTSFLLFWLVSTFDIFFMNHLFFFRQKTPLFYKFYVRTKTLVSHYSHHTLNAEILLNNYRYETSNIKILKENKETRMNSEKFTTKSKKTMRKIVNFFAKI